ncbi:hypothetical protein L218DRAFT_1005032 [Marasmius fiardii PR-910]|nr:hypothetical protein L218DRAFT_1005032 [Marasmius fiardii PR-910]
MKKAQMKIVGKRVPCRLCDMIFGGDVASTETLGHRYWNQPWVFGRVQEPPELIAHRIVLKQVGTSIRTFPNFKTLFNCAADAMEAHTWMLRELRILHRLRVTQIPTSDDKDTMNEDTMAGDKQRTEEVNEKDSSAAAGGENTNKGTKSDHREVITKCKAQDVSLQLLEDGDWLFKLLCKHANRMDRQEGEFIVNK